MATVLNDLLETAFCFSLGVFNVQCSTQHVAAMTKSNLVKSPGETLGQLVCVEMAVGWTKKVAKTKQ